MIPKPSSPVHRLPSPLPSRLEVVEQDLHTGTWIRIAARGSGTAAVWAADIADSDGTVLRELDHHYVGGAGETSKHSWMLELLTRLDLARLEAPIRLFFHFSSRPPKWMIDFLNRIENVVVVMRNCRPCEFMPVLKRVGYLASRTFAPVIAYTDASVRRSGQICGLGVLVVKDGQITRAHNEAYIAGSRKVGVCEGELSAIKLAVDLWLGDRKRFGSLGVRKLIVRTDSQHALEQISRQSEAKASPNSGTPWTLKARIAKEIINSTRGLGVEFQWVKAHNGDPLNDGADRLALAARRAAEAGLATTTAREISARIVADTAAAIAV